MQDIKFKHSTPVQVRFNDIDGLGHVNNTTIQEYFDLGRMHYMNAVFGSEILKGEATVIVVNINTDFSSPLYLKDELDVKTAIIHLGGKSLKMVQQVVDRKTGEAKAVCQSVMVGFNKVTEEGLELLPEWRKAVSQYEQRNL
ncbi:thioesterase family protein [Carboxylicivirga sp. M1479]|uniref:acyl-CoA thioesterase n=1 Tax=Carboxylicivirga sp. M1479 TaxID=2594476 RepID=UPI0011779BB6|nr:acyl-CoA thioesterase [Carboxylicivirga sp. M1479]TRX71024.1 acyl-CoA thioesterase [Carboxylicivirga sp. M1479]